MDKEVFSEITGSADPEIDAMMKAGVHLGHSKSKSHPSMRDNLYGIRNTIAIIDLVKTKEGLKKAEDFVREITQRGGLILLVGTSPAARRVIPQLAETTNMPYFIERWIGGTLTNYKTISKRVEHMQALEREKAEGGFEKYTKKERMKKDEEITRLKRFFDGLRRLTRLPDAVLVVDTLHDVTAVREARKMNIPLIAFVDSNTDINLVDIPIPANDDALSAVTYIISRLGAAMEDGQRMRGAQAK